jgi:hypothetical protein
MPDFVIWPVKSSKEIQSWQKKGDVKPHQFLQYVLVCRKVIARKVPLPFVLAPSVTESI